MPVTKPASGGIILAADIQAMHASVRAVANSEQVANLARGAFNHDQVASLLLGSDALEVTDGTMVSTNFGAETAADMASWQDLTGFLLNNGGAGYSLQPCFVLIYATVRVEQFYEPGGGTPSDPANLQQCWIGIVPTIDGVERLDIANAGFVFGQKDYTYCDEYVSILAVVSSAGAFTLNSVRVRGAKNGANVLGTAEDFKVVGGFMWFLAIPQNV